jgi:HAE1 family hydrophobic/amphiphilic exporter-1
VENVLKASEAVEGYNTISGYSLVTGAYASNMGFFFVQLKPWHDRHTPESTAAGLTQVLNRAFQRDIREAAVVAFGPPAIPGLGTGAGFTMQLQDRSGGPPEYLAQQAQKFMDAARKRPEIGRVSTLYRASVPQIYADIDRSKVMKAGVPLADVNTTLGSLLGSSYVNDFNRFGRVYKVYVQAEPEFRRDISQLGLFYVRNSEGGMVPLDTLLNTRPSSGPEFTNRFNLFRAAEITGVPAEGFSSAQALQALTETAQSVLPSDMSFDWADMSYQEVNAPGVAVVFMLAVLLVFLILAAQYESWGLPWSVLLGTPFAAFGAYLGLWLARQFLGPSYVNNVFAQIGLIMLIGLAAKNAILIVEFAKVELEQGKSVMDAALNAARLRLRPILMTAFAFILGVVPLLTATGAGAEARKVMGMTVFAGMLVATILGVLLVPMLFVFVERVTGRKHAPAVAGAPAAPLPAPHVPGAH